jgi:hypothetical protein
VTDITEPLLDILELVVMRNVFDAGYKVRVVGLLLKDCPPYRAKKWQRWWRASWRQRSENERIKERECDTGYLTEICAGRL